ncbi:MAG: cytochrome c biogenesis protein CcsA [Planctomycetes bacterium]|nr:cytochrome c biogenesis protein CcsA [Planctomycetota bacterium]
MSSRFKIRPIDVMVIGAILLYAGWKSAARTAPTVEVSAFAEKVNLEPLRRIAVQGDGRLRSFESHATTIMGFVTGRRSINNQSDGFTYLDMMFRPEVYENADIIYVKKKPVRAKIEAVLRHAGAIDEARGKRFIKSGLISKPLLRHPAAVSLLDELAADLIRTARDVDAIQSALAVSNPRYLEDQLRVIAPPDGSENSAWLPVASLVGPSGAPADDTHAAINRAATIPGLDPAVQDAVAEKWPAIRRAWRAENADEVNRLIAELAAVFPTISPSLYPSAGRLGMESWYFKYKSMTWVWLIYLLGVIPLLMSVIYKWDWARKAGMFMFVVAFGFHTSSIAIRWYISGRWPNANMFEAVTTSAWFGGVVAMILEWVSRRSPLRNIFALCSAVVSMAALMAAYFLPAGLDSGMRNKMAALNDVWLYIHTNVIISSYALIALAAVTGMLMLRHRWCVAWDRKLIPKVRLLIIPIALAILNYSGYVLMMHTISSQTYGLSPYGLAGATGSCVAALMILFLELAAGKDRLAAGVKLEKYAVGGAASLMMGTGPSQSFLKPEPPTTSQVLDGATMVLVELSFIALWTGLVMGAIWADHSWGRPWGWDPKEVFALNTFFIIIALIHVRMKVRDKGFWTAVLAVLGFEVMMFNWIVINFIVTGLHSYA